MERMMGSSDRSETAGSPSLSDPRALLTALYRAAVDAAAPGPAVREALRRIPEGERGGRPVWTIAIGKAAYPMADAAVAVLAEWGTAPAGGVVVAPEVRSAPHPHLTSIAGDHPVPGARSLAAAHQVGEVAARVRPDDEVWVLLSGGATSLAAAPVAGVHADELIALYERLLASGLAIDEMNLIRKRFSRWGAGRLAVALAPARVRNLVLSDVVGDDIAAIGSGPCVPDPATALELRALLAGAGLWDELPASMRGLIDAAEHDPACDTPKPGAGAFAHVESVIVASNRIALEAVAARARALGCEPRIMGAALAGEAADVGRRVATTVRSYCESVPLTLSGRRGGTCLVWGGETTVTLGARGGRGERGACGGRCQELALAAAQVLARPGAPGATTGTGEIAILAAGTDGRDGPTDAAGAIVDRTTWEAIRRAGRDPERDLQYHDAYRALDAAGALLRTGLTGTNVMDVVIGLCIPPVMSA
jgi:glycerate 2-kinase